MIFFATFFISVLVGKSKGISKRLISSLKSIETKT